MSTALIVGAGIGGLAAGASLLRAGWTVRIFERASNPRELGFALNLAPNAIAALREIGIADDVIQGGYAARLAELRGDLGRVLRRVDARHTTLDSVVAMRPVVHGALMAAVGSDTLALSREATHFQSRDDGNVTLYFADGSAETGDILIGADGIASVIRRQLHPEEPAPRPSGYSAIRGAVDDIGDMLGELHGVLYMATGVEAAVVRAGARAAYWYMSLLTREIPTDFHDVRSIAGRSAARLDDTFRGVLAATDDSDMRFDELYSRNPLTRWGQGPVTLLGDAAHPMLPHTGQGAAQALEDAVALGLALRRDNDAPRALRRYEEVRMARTAKFVALGPRIARVSTSRRALVSVLRNTAIRFAPMPLILSALQKTDRRDPHRALR